MINNVFTAWLARFLAMRITPEREPDFIIGGSDNPYMLRWYIIPRNRILNVYLHYINRSDDDRAPHDHPWPSLSLMLYGTLIEHVRTPSGVLECRAITAGSLVYRSAKFAHRLEVPRGRAAWTLFVTGPKIRSWGFYLCGGQRWIEWTDFCDETDSGKAKEIKIDC